MARKPLGPNDVNEYYKAMGARPESQAWEMPIYNDAKGKPITGQARKAPQKSGSFTAPVYNYQGKPVINEKTSNQSQSNAPMYRVAIYRPGVRPGQLFKAPRYNNGGKPIINNTLPQSGSGNIYRPSKLKTSGTPVPMARNELDNVWGENRKVYLNNNFTVKAPMEIGSFSRISGLEAEWELETYREGGNNSGDHYFPRQIRNSNLVFEYGTGLLDPLLEWFDKINQGIIVKHDLMIYLTDERQVEVRTWMALNAMPVRYSAPHFDAMVSEVAITRLEFIHSGLISVF